MPHETWSGVPLKTADEQDALSGWRKLIRFRPGVRKAAKRRYNRRIRRRFIYNSDETGPDNDRPDGVGPGLGRE